MKPQTGNREENSLLSETQAPAAQAVRGRIRYGRFAVSAAAVFAMVAVAMVPGKVDKDASPLLSVPEQAVNAAPQEGATDLADPAGPGSAPAPSQPSRVGGGGGTATSIAISKRAFSSGAEEVYIVRLDNPVDALAGSVLSKGPMLLVPSTGYVPPEVFTEIKRLKAKRVVILGGPGAISNAVANQFPKYTGRKVVRIAGDNRVDTAIKIAQYGFPQGSKVVYVADAMGADFRGSPDSVAGGVLTDGPILTFGRDNTRYMNAVAATVRKMGAKQVVALGGPAAVTNANLKQVAGSAKTGRLGGANRYATANAVSKRAFPNGAKTAYLVPGNDLSYGLIAGSLTDGPIVMVPTGPSDMTRGLVTSFGNPNVVAVGGTEILSNTVSQIAAGYASANGAKIQVSPVSTTQSGYLKYSKAPSPLDAAREVSIYNNINKVRASKGVKALKRNSQMDDAARAWSQQMARTDVFVHSSASKTLKYSTLFPAGWKFAGENICGYYYMEPGPFGAGATKLWVDSPGHYANLINKRFTHTGIGVASGGKWVYATQNFGQY